MAYFGKFVLQADFQADLPIPFKAVKIPKGTVVEGLVQRNGDEVSLLVEIKPPAGANIPAGQKSPSVSIPMSVLKTYNEAPSAKSYNWLYLAIALGVGYWYVTRGKKKRPQEAPAGFAGISGIDEVVVYDNGGKSFDRYTVFTPDGSVYGMSENASGFNLYLGEEGEISKGSHLGKKLKSVPAGIRDAVKERMKQ